MLHYKVIAGRSWTVYELWNRCERAIASRPLKAMMDGGRIPENNLAERQSEIGIKVPVRLDFQELKS